MPNMPPSFVIPNADPWPIRTRGFPLGSEVRVVRSRQVTKIIIVMFETDGVELFCCGSRRHEIIVWHGCRSKLLKWLCGGLYV